MGALRGFYPKKVVVQGEPPWRAQCRRMTQYQDRALPVDLTREYLIEKCEYFSSIGIWPSKVVLDPEYWLDNFLEDETEHALYLLNAFMYFSAPLIDQIFGTSIRTIGRGMTGDQWSQFLDTILVTIVSGEEPSVTDSGYSFARKARALGIPDERIISPEQAGDRIQSGFGGPIVFVDDLIGSGDQFIRTWYRTSSTQYNSFEALSSSFPATFYYCPAFCTEFGRKRIQSECPEVTVNPGILIPDDYGALSPDSILWPSKLRGSAEEFIRLASQRAGIPDTGGTEPNDWRGYASLGLTIALEGSVPDATLPIIHWEQNGWHPLIRRTA